MLKPENIGTKLSFVAGAAAMIGTLAFAGCERDDDPPAPPPINVESCQDKSESNWRTICEGLYWVISSDPSVPPHSG